MTHGLWWIPLISVGTVCWSEFSSHRSLISAAEKWFTVLQDKKRTFFCARGASSNNRIITGIWAIFIVSLMECSWKISWLLRDEKWISICLVFVFLKKKKKALLSRQPTSDPACKLDALHKTKTKWQLCRVSEPPAERKRLSGERRGSRPNVRLARFGWRSPMSLCFSQSPETVNAWTEVWQILQKHLQRRFIKFKFYDLFLTWVSWSCFLFLQTESRNVFVLLHAETQKLHQLPSS